MRLLAPVRRSTFLVLLGAALVSMALTVAVAITEPTPMAAVSVPEPVTPTTRTPAPSPTATTQPDADPTTDPPAEQAGDEDLPMDSGGGQPMGRHAPGEPTPPAKPGTAFQAVAGPACPVDARRGVRISGGWEVVPGDSWTEDGCGDRFLYSAPEDQNYLQYRFTLTGPSDCRVAVFVPDSPLASDVVWYGIGDRFDNADYRVGGFTVDQKARRGEWVDGATVPIGNGMLMVTVEGDQNQTGVAAAPVRVSC